MDAVLDSSAASAVGGTFSLDVVESLIPALAGSFGPISLAYVLGKAKVVPPEVGRALGAYTTLVALPALVFRSLATLDFGLINWGVVGGVSLAKLAVFVLVGGASRLLGGPRPEAGAEAGIYAIFASQSNDFAMGLPIIQVRRRLRCFGCCGCCGCFGCCVCSGGCFGCSSCSGSSRCESLAR